MDLEKYIEKDTIPPTPADMTRPTREEIDAGNKWKEGDAKARTRLELAIGDGEMVHIVGATTARQMWDQLSMVKESKGHLGILATRRTLFNMRADEGTDLATHISTLRQLQEELHIMGNLISDEDFALILLTSLPEILGRLHDIILGIQWK